MRNIDLCQWSYHCERRTQSPINSIGQEAAEKLRQRLLSDGIHADIVSVPYAIPTNTKGIDWNDVLVNYGQLGFSKSFG